MKELFDKISSYNIFNYLFPGILFVILANYFVGYNLYLKNDFLGAFLYYFIGMSISAFGSVIIEPMLIRIRFLRFESYKSFVDAVKKDVKIDILSELSHTYRTVSSMLILLLGLKAYSFLSAKLRLSNGLWFLILVVLLLILFLFSYRKQTDYISKRIKANA